MTDFLEQGNIGVELTHTKLENGTAISFAVPQNPNSKALVLIPDVFGLRDLVDETIVKIASKGTTVIAVEPFSRLSDNPELLSRDEKLSRVNELSDDKQLGDLGQIKEKLTNDYGCTQVGLIGFCIGGMYAFKSAGLGIFDSVVSCYGMITLPQAWKGPGQKEPLEYLKSESSSRVLAIIGQDDKPFAKDEDLDLLKNLFSAGRHGEMGSRVEIFKDCDHAFMHDPNREEHRFEDAKRAWVMAYEFLGI